MNGPTEIPAESTQASMSQRYGAGRPRRRGVGITLGTVVAVALLAWAVWAGWPRESPAIDATLTSYDVVSTHEVRVTVSAEFRDADVHGSCLLRATAEDHTVVGELNLTADQLRAAKGSWIPIRTERRATTAELVRCSD